MVAEERITTKFSGLVGAHGSEEEATFLSTQQVDEARHMQFYARFQDEVVAEPAASPPTSSAPARRSRRPSARSSTRRWSRPTSGSSPPPRDLAAKVRFVTIYHLILESTLGLTTFRFATDYLEREGLLPGFVEGYSKIHHDETRHIGYGVWFLREAVAREPGAAEAVRATLRELLPSVAESLTPPDRDGHRLGRARRGLRRDPRVRARRPRPAPQRHRRAPLEPLTRRPMANRSSSASTTRGARR